MVGPYERGDRSVPVKRRAELAAFYGVPVQELLPGGPPGARTVGYGPSAGAVERGQGEVHGPRRDVSAQPTAEQTVASSRTARGASGLSTPQ
ncbi:hypothetical protein UK12_34685, partial [Saccharothrix sp. ST-888]